MGVGRPALGAAAIALVGAALLLAAPAGEAASAARACRAACAAQNLAGSCRWLAAKPSRCHAHGLQLCRAAVRAGAAARCAPPPELPACLSNNGCPFGALCADGACQVVPCGGGCAGHQTCQGDHCVVADCEASTQNCPAGLHCEPALPPYASISGTCAADDPSVHYCTSHVDCIVPGTPNLRCDRGRCVHRKKKGGGHHRATTTTLPATTTTAVSTTTTTSLPACADVFDCPGGSSVCCSGHCVPDPYAGKGICTTSYAAQCTLCDLAADDCPCNGIFCDSCEGSASLSGCVDPCAH